MDYEFCKIINPILENEEFLKRRTYMHHEDVSVFLHSLKVSYKSYIITKNMGLDYKSAAIGGLLHDFYDNPWQEDTKKTTFFKKHGFIHAKQAKENANKHFKNIINNKVENIIERHMFPLNIIPPKYKEAWIVNFVDKYVSIRILITPKVWHKYLGFKKKIKEEV